MPEVELISQAANVRLIGKVGHEQVGRRVPGGGLNALLEGSPCWLASSHQDNGCAALGELHCHDFAEATVGAGDHTHPPNQRWLLCVRGSI
jgi:hypothetical protein